MDRRDFLQWTGAGVTAAAAMSSMAWWRPEAGAAAGPGRTTPAHPVVLRSQQLDVTLDGEDGLPVSYRLAGGATMAGEDAGRPMTATVCRLQPRSYATVTLRAAGVRRAADHVDFRFHAAADVNDNKSAASFVVRYRIDGATLFVSLEEIHEQRGFELIEVAMPQLVTVHEERGLAWLAHGDSGGSLVHLAQATPGSLHPNRFWGKILTSLPVVMAGTDQAVCVQEVTAFMDTTELTVDGEAGRRRGFLGTVKRHRVNGSLSYDMNAGPGVPRIAGNEHTPNLLIGETPACRLDFIGVADNGKAPNWLDAAKRVRSRMPRIPTPYYDDKFVYDLMCDLPKLPAPPTPFAQAGEFIRQVEALTDGAPQVVHLWGWQYRGKDTGYPAVAQVDARIGGYDAMLQLMEKARALNCLVTLSDNYDDAYRSSPAWNEKYIARRPDGQLWESRNWTGENSWVQGMAKYMEGPGRERVRYTCERYRLRESTHIDVLSYYSIRNDWDPQRPASGIRNLQARYEVVDLFRQHGVDVSSEFLRYAFIGKISSFMNGMSGGKCPFGGEPIPLMATIYRKSAVWGQNGKNKDAVEPILKMLFYNGRASLFFGHTLDVERVSDYYYLMLVPWFQLNHRHLESFERSGDTTRMELEDGADVEIDWQQRRYSVKLAGREVARNGLTACPVGTDRIAVYATEDQEIELPLPPGWDAAQAGALCLSIHGAEAFPFTTQDGRLTLSLKARQPVMVYRDRAAAQRRMAKA